MQLRATHKQLDALWDRAHALGQVVVHGYMRRCAEILTTDELREYCQYLGDANTGVLGPDWKPNASLIAIAEKLEADPSTRNRWPQIVRLGALLNQAERRKR